MALTKCVDCGAKMGETAPICLQCGAKAKPKTGTVTKLFAGFFVFVVVYSIFKPTPEAPKNTPAPEAMVYPRAEISSTARAMVRANSKDSDSLKFRNEFSAQTGIYCGEVNGKNSFGGYTGFVRFIANSRTLLMDEGQTETFKQAWQKFCTVKQPT